MDFKLLELPLKVLKVPGVDPLDNSLFAKICSALTLLFGILVCISSVMELNYGEWTIIAIVPVVETFMASLETLGRWGVLFVFKNRIIELINDSKGFWEIADVDSKRETEAEATVQMVWRGIRIYTVSVFITGATAILKAAVFSWHTQLPFAAWFPRSFHYGYEIFYAMQVVYIVFTVTLVVGADTLFAAFCGQLIAQFKLLNQKLQNTKHIETNRDFLLNMEDSVRYHLNLIRFGEKLGSVYFTLLLVQYVITASASCVELFMVSKNLNSFAAIASFLSYIITLSTQMGLFCFLAEAVMDESAKTSLAVYSSDWYTRNIEEVGMHVQMIITRASKPITFSGGGLFLIGRVAWFKVLKMAFSIFTLLTSVQ